MLTGGFVEGVFPRRFWIIFVESYFAICFPHDILAYVMLFIPAVFCVVHDECFFAISIVALSILAV